MTLIDTTTDTETSTDVPQSLDLLEILIGEIERVRAALKAQHGWVMDTYLLRSSAE